MQSRRYETLDALRGVAALAVVGFHLGTVGLEPGFMPSGFLAVDFFFVLSGFVVAHAYEARLSRCLSVRAFMVRRVARLYPLACLGAMLGFVVLLIKHASFPGRVDSLPRILVAGVMNGFLLPTFFGGEASRHDLFPTNGPLWSLFFELVANCIWAITLARCRARILAALALSSLAALAMAAVAARTVNVGFDTATFVGGAARVGLGFPLGVLLYRLHHADAQAPRGAPLALAALLLAVLARPHDAATQMAWLDLISVAVLLPTIVLLGAATSAVGRLGAWAGALSYPVYVLHFPILLIASGLHQTLLWQVDSHVMSFATIIILIAFAHAAMRLTAPAEQWLHRALAASPTPDRFASVMKE